jgi:hypothetical protein
MQHFGIPGKTLVGSDKYTPVGGSLGILFAGSRIWFRKMPPWQVVKTLPFSGTYISGLLFKSKPLTF